jgi:NodT family efflux transporter outer membrane factor (OMF) lipoprotein
MRSKFKNRVMLSLVVGMGAVALGGCSTVRVEMPESTLKLPDRFDAVDTPVSRGADLAHWWQVFNDPVLTALIEEGLQHNADVKIAMARIQEARAFHGMAESAFLPTLEGAAGASRSRQTSHLPVNFQPELSLPLPVPVTIGLPPVSQDLRMPLGNTTGGSLMATWELDLFGARHADADMVQQLVYGAQEQEHGAQLLVAADIASRYFEARGGERRLAVLMQAVQVAERGHHYAQGRFKAGHADASEVDQAEMQWRAAQAQVEPLKALIASHVRRIAVLMGRLPQAFIALPAQPAAAKGAASMPPLPAVLPGDVLARRPDVRGMARKVLSQVAKVGSAKAELFPKFYLGLGATAGRLHPDHASGHNFGTQMLGVGMRLPIFEAGRIRQHIAAQEAQLQGLAVQYEQTVLGALEDVENVYTAHRAFCDKSQKLTQAAQLADQIAQRKRALFQSGQVLLQVALEAQATALQKEDDAIQASVSVQAYTVLLYKALGGGWSEPGAVTHLAGTQAYAMSTYAP